MRPVGNSIPPSTFPLSWRAISQCTGERISPTADLLKRPRLLETTPRTSPGGDRIRDSVSFWKLGKPGCPFQEFGLILLSTCGGREIDWFSVKSWPTSSPHTEI